MSNGIIVDTSYFEGVDLDRPSIKHPIFEKMQANAKTPKPQEQNELIAFFDSDVQQAIKAHNTPQDRVRLNAVLRALYMTA